MVIKHRLRWYHLLKRGPKLLPSETSNLVYVNEKVYKHDNIKYIVEKLLKMLFNGNVFGKQYLYKYTNNYISICNRIHVSILC